MDTPENQSGDNRRLPLLDGLRGFAALAVMFFHAIGYFGNPLIFARSYLFVDLFFMLSGFVLGLSVDPRLRDGLRSDHFLLRRAKRLWPMIAAGALIGGIAALPEAGPQQAALLTALAILLLPALHNSGAPYGINPPFWSLAAELLANVAHALLLWRCTARTLWIATAISALWLLGEIVVQGANNHLHMAHNWPLAFSRIAFAYTFGLALARGHGARIARSGADRSWLLAVLLVTLPPLLLSVTHLPPWVGDSVVTLLALPLGVVMATQARLPVGLAPACSAIGLISYPLYAVHMPMQILVARWFSGIEGLFVSTGSALLLATLLALAFERRKKPRTAAPWPRESARLT